MNRNGKYNGTGRRGAQAHYKSLRNQGHTVTEDERLLVINKQAGLVCHPTKSGPFSSLISRVRIYLGDAVQPQLINRLDRETSGLIMPARSRRYVSSDA